MTERPRELKRGWMLMMGLIVAVGNGGLAWIAGAPVWAVAVIAFLGFQIGVISERENQRA